MNSTAKIAALLPAVVCAVATLGFSQTAQLTGRVTDTSEAIIRETAITAVNQETGVRYRTATNESGNYTVPLLPPGNYRVTAEKAGFRQVSRTGLRLEVEQKARVDFVLEVGQVTESINVVPPPRCWTRRLPASGR